MISKSPVHTKDADCILEDGLCTGCGAVHGEPCPDCGARAYHEEDCTVVLAVKIATADRPAAAFQAVFRGTREDAVARAVAVALHLALQDPPSAYAFLSILKEAARGERRLR